MISKFLGYEIEYLNRKEFGEIKKEIFSDEIYSFQSSKSNPYIIDIGSHIGLSIIYFKKLYPKSTILGFEPNPKLFDILERNVELNGLNNVRLFNQAVSKVDGKVPFFVDPTNDYWYSTGSLIDGGWTKKEDVMPILVDSTNLNSHINTQVDMLKIDAEGKELTILESIKDRLNLVENIVLEYHPGVNFKKITSLLLKNSYKVTYRQNGKVVKIPDQSQLLVISASR